MMYLLNRSEPTLFQTHLAQRVSRNVPLSYLPPCSAVFLVAVGRTDELVIAVIHLLCVFLAVLSVTTVGTAGVGTGALWSSGHGVISLGIEKALRVIKPTTEVPCTPTTPSNISTTESLDTLRTANRDILTDILFQRLR